MTEQYNTFLIALLFVLLIGIWLLVNALIDVAARRCRRRLGNVWSVYRSWRGDGPSPTHQPAPDASASTEPGIT